MTLKKTIALSLFLGLPAETYLQASDISDGTLLGSRATLSAALDDADFAEDLQVYADNSLEGLTQQLGAQRSMMHEEVSRVTGLNTYLLRFFNSLVDQGEFDEEKLQLPRFIAKLPAKQAYFILNNLRAFQKAYNFNVATYGGISYTSMLDWTQDDLDRFRRLRELRSNMAYNQAVIQSQIQALEDWIIANTTE